MRSASFPVAVIFAAEIGDVRRFDTPPQLMAFVGLVPGERSTGDTVRRSSAPPSALCSFSRPDCFAHSRQVADPVRPQP